MWKLNWEDNTGTIDEYTELHQTLEDLNNEYKNKRPVFVQIQNYKDDCMCIGIGEPRGYSFVEYYSGDGMLTKHVEGENAGDETVVFFMGDSETELFAKDTIRFETALKIVDEFSHNNTVADFVNWIDDGDQH